MSNQPSSVTTYSLEKASEHIYYEAWMFYETASRAINSIVVEEVNINLESFSIHARNLFNFLYPMTSRPKRDDIWVTDYIKMTRSYNSSKTNKRELKFILNKTAKQVGHLTYRRNKYNSENKGWPVYDIVIKIHKTLTAFYQELDDGYKKWPYFEELNGLLEKKEKFLQQ